MAADASPPPDREGLLEMFRLLCRTRAAEERVEVLQKQGHPVGALYRSLGQEGGAVGAACALRRRADGTGDVIAPSLRAAGALFAFGAGLRDYFRQYLGRATAPSRGRETDLHWRDPARGIMAPVTPLGLMVEVMAGVTLALRREGGDRVGMVFHGDGATSTGAWHEGLCFAAARRCPLILVVENNQWAFGTPTEKTTRVAGFVDKAPAYGVAAEAVDGTDVVAVHAVVRAAAARARAGEGVQMVELRYFRRRGHAQHDAQEYVDPALVAEWEQRDPLTLFRARLLEEGLATADDLDRVGAEETEACAAAAATALGEPLPDGAQALAPVLTDHAYPAPWTRHAVPAPAAG